MPVSEELWKFKYSQRNGPSKQWAVLEARDGVPLRFSKTLNFNSRGHGKKKTTLVRMGGNNKFSVVLLKAL